jgi:hypothetical protein
VILGFVSGVCKRAGSGSGEQGGHDQAGRCYPSPSAYTPGLFFRPVILGFVSGV